MAKVGGYTINEIYQGGYSTLKPEYGDVFTGYRANVASLGIGTDPRSAAILKDFSDRTNLGVKHVEVATISPQVLDAVPKQYFKEMDRMRKLTGVDVSFHGPLVEPSGMTQQGFTESNREAAERQIEESIERVHEANPEHTLVNFHTSNLFPSPKIKKVEGGEIVESIYVINQETGNIGEIKAKERFYPGETGPTDMQKEINHHNEESWKSSVTNFAYHADRGLSLIHATEHAAEVSKLMKENKGAKLTDIQKRQVMEYNLGVSFVEDSYRQFKDLFNMAYSRVPEHEKKFLIDLKESIEEKAKKLTELKDEKPLESIRIKQEILESGQEVFNKLHPIIFKPIDEFMIGKTSQTFGNAAFDAYKKFPDAPPVVLIENPPANQQFSRGEDVKNIVERAREQFVERAKKEGMSDGEARKQAEKVIGATWDVGHINMMRKFGFDEEDIVKETEKVAPLVKHIHLSDNFGFEHTELPMGMGNVPLKEIMEKLGKKGFEAKKIIEAGDWWSQHFTKGAGAPFTPSLEGLGSPIYAMKMAPYWNQSVGFQQGYTSGMGQFLPQINYETFGGGFSQLPTELGGQRQGGAGGRMSGRPME